MRYRDYHADAAVTVALRIEPADGEPTLAALAAALDEPARPLFIGRKPCLPCGRVFLGMAAADTALQAAIDAPLAVGAGDRPRLFWAGDGGEHAVRQRTFTLCDHRNWRTGVHGGWRMLHEGIPAAGRIG